MLKLSLETVAGWDVLSACSGIDGITTAIAEQPDAIVVDALMPSLDGPATLQEIRKTPAIQHIPVILLTGLATSRDVRRLSALDFAALLTKPFDPLRIADEISAALGWG